MQRVQIPAGGAGAQAVRRRGLGPADRVTAVRLALTCAVAVLVAGSLTGRAHTVALVVLASIALLLDLVDGWIARRTGSASEFGARFDMEVDALLILVLSVQVAATLAWWALLIGLARYLLGAAGRCWPWLRGIVPPRRWAKVVAAVQGVVLTVVSTGLVPSGPARAAVAVALLLLVESFGNQVGRLWRARSDHGVDGDAVRRLRGTASVLATVAAGLAVWGVLVLPDRTDDFSAAGLLRLPIELSAVLLLVLVLPRRAGRVLCGGFGVLLALVLLVKLLDLGFHTVLDRQFDPLSDFYYLGPGIGVLRDSSGPVVATGAVVGAVLLVVLLLTVLPLSVVRLAGAASGRSRVAVPVLTALALLWGAAAAAGVRLDDDTRLASASAATIALDQVATLRSDLADRQVFARQVADDPYAAAATDRLLTGLRGKDVLVAFVESYGRVAVQGSSFSPGVDAVLDSGTRRLRAAGFSSRSAFLTSPTFGAASWLAHSTLQSGLWVDSQRRYDQLVTARRLTLTDAFGRAGWRTVFDVPAITKDWPDGGFYDFDQLYDSRNVGYRGPAFSYATMPDQYTLAALWRNELAPADRPPVMAEVDLVSSHHPWTPLPRLVPWDEVGDGSVFEGMPEQGRSPDDVFRDPDDVRTMYGRSIEYTLDALVSFVEEHPDPDLVLVLLGDHQPHHYVSGDDPGHDVPITVVAHDPAVMKRIAGWGWQDGMRPAADAPVWRMDTFRDRFLTAFGPRNRIGGSR